MAVSGGVDSVVLLDALMNRRRVAGVDPWGGANGQVIVAHFDHGIRPDSAEDEQFVRQRAKTYGCEYRSTREELGAYASEELARTRRYQFLRAVCHEFGGTLVTAHHVGDIAETIAINVTRGTGWRGLAVMDNHQIMRPLLSVTKQEITGYANEHGLTWREDSTNASDKYLRNRIRQRINDEDIIWQLAALRARQVELKQYIDTAAQSLISQSPYSRYFFTHCGDKVAIELLRTVFIRETGSSPTPVVRRRVLHEIKVARPGATVPAAEGVHLRFTKTDFIVDASSKVLS